MIVAPIGFQFTPLREGRRKAAQEIQRGGAISIHAPPRGATRWQEPNRVRTPFQFTPLREGRPMCGIRVRWRRRISIHAPPRGATRVFAVRAMVDAISIHAPPRGATSHCHYNTGKKGNFNSRPSARGDCRLHNSCSRQFQFQFTPLREGRQAFVEFCLKKYAGISIHAPPRGATHQRERFSPSTLFQFTPLREGRR